MPTKAEWQDVGKSLLESGKDTLASTQGGGGLRPVANDLEAAETARAGYEMAMTDPGGRKALDESIAKARGSRKKGGRIRKTGVYRLHKGEFVVPAHVVQRLDKIRKGSRKSAR